MKLVTDLDFVKFYARKMKEDSKVFEQQKMLIESQLENSKNVFRSLFGTGEDFKINARKYLGQMGLIKSSEK